jgi:BlaI family transcriptional regulator, penicillinase repressor
MKLSEAEWQIMNALWKLYPATAREVIERIPVEKSWAYTTVKTMLSRLVAKKVVAEVKRGNTSYYEPLIEQEQAQKSAVSHLLDKVLEGAAAPLMLFLLEKGTFSRQEREALRRVLKEKDQEGERRD